MHTDELGTLDVSLGISRRLLLRRAAVGSTLVWATPLVQSFAGPSAAAGTPVHDIAYVAVLLSSRSSWYRMGWETAAAGLTAVSGPALRLAGSHDQLLPPSGQIAAGAAPGTAAGLNADGSVTVWLGSSCTLVDFRVRRGPCWAGPSVAGEPPAGQTGGFVTFRAASSPRRCGEVVPG
jgi:hypothetical protein